MPKKSISPRRKRSKQNKKRSVSPKHPKQKRSVSPTPKKSFYARFRENLPTKGEVAYEIMIRILIFIAVYSGFTMGMVMRWYIELKHICTQNISDDRKILLFVGFLMREYNMSFHQGLDILRQFSKINIKGFPDLDAFFRPPKDDKTKCREILNKYNIHSSKDFREFMATRHPDRTRDEKLLAEGLEVSGCRDFIQSQIA